MSNTKTKQGVSGWLNSYHYSYKTESQQQDKNAHNEEYTKLEKEDSNILVPASDKHAKKIFNMNLLNEYLGPAGLL